MIRPHVVLLAAMLALALTHLAAAQMSHLSFVKSPTSGKHVAVQPQTDHHRVHALVRVQSGAGRFFEAQMNSITSREIVTSTVRFAVLKDDQIWSLYLRAPKDPKGLVQYTLTVRSADDGVSDTLIYVWNIGRSNDGTATFKSPPAGRTSEWTYSVFYPKAMQRANGTIEWSIVSEMRTQELSVPSGFVFGLDQRGSVSPITVNAMPID